MPQYYFDVHDGTDLVDDEGTELADLATARRAAVQFAGALLIEHAEQFWTGEEWQLDVRAEGSPILFSLIFIAVEAGSASRPRREP